MSKESKRSKVRRSSTHTNEYRFEKVDRDTPFGFDHDMGSLNGRYVRGDTVHEAQSNLPNPGRGQRWRLDTRSVPWKTRVPRDRGV